MAKTTKQQLPILTYTIIFLIGFVCGTGFAVFKLGAGGDGKVPAASQQADSHAAETTKAISNLEAQVTAEPENFTAWVQLGHLYFDTDQYDKAIKAYETSLQFHSGDANLLTDLGVMYRRSDQPKKALEWFDKAQAMDPLHQPSRFNEGIVRLYDLGDAQGAIASWEELLKINPDAKAGNGQSIRDFVDEIKRDQAQK